MAEWGDIVVTMGCGDEGPYFPGKRYIDWALPDPPGGPVGEVRSTRGEIQGRVTALLTELDVPVSGSKAAGTGTDGR
jgi:arsenate reductase (thioredoxin)